MHVTRIYVNQGETRRETGFLNPELQQRLGLIDDGPGRKFCYAFQITLYLHALSPEDVVLARQFHERTYKADIAGLNPITAFDQRQLRFREGWPTEAKPYEHDVKRERKAVVIQAGPGPDAHYSERQVYPLSYEGRFYLKVENRTGDLLAAIEYYVRLIKRSFDAPAEGDFELIKSDTYEPALHLATRLTLNPWLQNWDLCRLPNCSFPGRLPMEMDRSSLRNWLSPYQGDAMKLAQVRQFLWQGGTGPEVYRYPDDVVIDQLSDLLWSGRIHAHSRERTMALAPDRRSQATVYIERDFGNDYAPFPISERKPRETPSPVRPASYGVPLDPGTFPAGSSFAAQAAILLAAAQSGAPCVGL